MSLRSFHADGAWVVVGTNAAVGAWALAAHRWEQYRSRWLWVATIVAELTVLAQVGLGTALVALQHHEVAGFHALYGFSAFATVGIVYSYRQQMPGRQHLLYGLGGLFLMGLALRAIQVSPFPPG
jgi:predicted transporter